MDENIYYREFIHPSIEVNKHCCSVGSQQKIPLGSWFNVFYICCRVRALDTD